MDRLIKYLLANESSWEKLAGASNMSIDRIREIANGGDPNLSEIGRITDALKVPIDFFIIDDLNEGINLRFRQNDIALNKADIDEYKIARKVSLSADLLGDAKNRINWISNLRKENLSKNDPKDLANRVRQVIIDGDELSPLHQLPQLLSNLQILIFSESNRNIDGASSIHRGWSFAFVSRRFAPRMLFTLAHELGHLVSGHLSPNQISVDKDISAYFKARKIRQEERFANQFASCLLMPEEGTIAALGEVKSLIGATRKTVGDIEILFLAHIFGVSFEVSGYRLEQLGLLPSGATAALYDTLKREFGSPEKRAKEADLPPRPKVRFDDIPKPVVDAATNAIESGEYSIGYVGNVFNLDLPSLYRHNKSAAH